ncbi:MAG: M48 family metallopeptidase [Gemmatimonadales bacterium]
MSRSRITLPMALAAAALLIASPARPLAAQINARPASPGFNLFSVSQDVEMGRASAIEAEKQLRLANDPAANRYLTSVVQRLAAVAPGAKYPYTVKLVVAPEINAFSLPGGPMYVNTGLLAAARNESELAGVLAHEMAHVALRHGTNQASTAYLAKGGVSILGGLLGKGSSNTSSVVNAIGGLGLNAAFLSFSRSAESQADATGADMMARAGYNPVAMADFFDVLRAEQGRDPSKLEQFFSDHPGSAERSARIRTLAQGATVRNVADVGGFATIHSRALQGTSTATASNVPGRLTPPADQPGNYGSPTAITAAAPSTRVVRYRQPSGFLQINMPSNWQVAQSNGTAIVVAPAGGIVATSDGIQHIVYGVILNHYAPFANSGNTAVNRYAPFEGNSTSGRDLADATDDLVNTIIRANPYLRADANSARPETISGAAGYSVALTGTSPVTGETEEATLFTRGLPDGHVIYGLSIVPASRATEMDPAMIRLMRSLVVSDAAGHRADAAQTNFRGLRLGARQRP